MRKRKSTKAFALVASPLAIAVLCSPFALAADPDNSSTSPALRGTIGAQGSPPASAGTVESFFQVAPLNKSPQGAKVQTASASDKKPALKGAGRALWHIMDNAGVPMFLGKNNDLDPSIDTSRWTPPPLVPNLKRVDKPSDNPKQTVMEAPSQIETSAIHKIPKSELEGVELPTLHDAQTATH